MQMKLYGDLDSKAKKPVHKGIPRGRPFPKGWAGGPGRGHKRPEDKVGAEIERDMRLAYTLPPSPSDSPAVKQYRKLFLEDAGKFMALYVKVMGNRPDDSEEESGECEERARHLIDELLAEWNTSLRDFLGESDGPNAVAEGEAGQAGETPEGGDPQQAARHHAGDQSTP